MVLRIYACKVANAGLLQCNDCKKYMEAREIYISYAKPDGNYAGNVSTIIIIGFWHLLCNISLIIRKWKTKFHCILSSYRLSTDRK